MTKFAPLPAWAVDEDLEAKTGITLDYGDGMKFRVKRAGGANREFQRVHGKIMNPTMKRRQELGQISDEESATVNAKILARACVIGWEGVKAADGSEVSYNEDNFIGLMVAYPRLLLSLTDQLMTEANFHQTEIQETAKNSRKPSDKASA